MYALKRILAYLIDVVIVLTLVSLINGIHIKTLIFAFVEGIAWFDFLSPNLLILTGVLPIVLYGTMIGQLGWTPGKRLLNLRVNGSGNRPVGIGKGILRETIKCAAVTFLIFGLAWALYGMISEGRTFYDRWLDVSVDDETPVQLTDTQKNWREFHGED
jgi:hypothetical protein